jgi:hypothetical protein
LSSSRKLFTIAFALNGTAVLSVTKACALSVEIFTLVSQETAIINNSATRYGGAVPNLFLSDCYTFEAIGGRLILSALGQAIDWVRAYQLRVGSKTRRNNLDTQCYKHRIQVRIE